MVQQCTLLKHLRHREHDITIELGCCEVKVVGVQIDKVPELQSLRTSPFRWNTLAVPDQWADSNLLEYFAVLTLSTEPSNVKLGRNVVSRAKDTTSQHLLCCTLLWHDSLFILVHSYPSITWQHCCRIWRQVLATMFKRSDCIRYRISNFTTLSRK